MGHVSVLGLCFILIGIIFRVVFIHVMDLLMMRRWGGYPPGIPPHRHGRKVIMIRFILIFNMLLIYGMLFVDFYGDY